MLWYKLYLLLFLCFVGLYCFDYLFFSLIYTFIYLPIYLLFPCCCFLIYFHNSVDYISLLYFIFRTFSVIYMYFCFTFSLLIYLSLVSIVFIFCCLFYCSCFYFLVGVVIEASFLLRAICRSMVAVNRVRISTVIKVGFRLFTILAEDGTNKWLI